MSDDLASAENVIARTWCPQCDAPLGQPCREIDAGHPLGVHINRRLAYLRQFVDEHPLAHIEHSGEKFYETAAIAAMQVSMEQQGVVTMGRDYHATLEGLALRAFDMADAMQTEYERRRSAKE